MSKIVKHSRYSYLVSLRDPTKAHHPHYCNGILVGERQVVTSAHCVDPNTGGHPLPVVHVGRECHNCPGDFLVVQSRSAKADSSWMGRVGESGDIAIVFLDTPVVGVTYATLSLDTEAVRRFGFNYLHSFTYDRYGTISELELLAREARTCTRAYNEGGFPEMVVNDGMLCASSLGPDDICQGYSGAPLIIKGTNSMDDLIVGIMSFGTAGCQLPAVYADVALYANDLLMLLNTGFPDTYKGSRK
jgi:secreted trypsin-like serine protease